MRYDTIIVGGGSAGGVLAARASEQDPGRSVLLLEAGPDFGPKAADQPDDVLDAGDPGPTAHDWGLEAALGALARTSPVYAGRLLGGSSATNNVMALRGRPEDYDAWAAAGNTGWSFAEVLPAFARVERDLNFGADPWHGDAGPVPVRRPPGLSPVQRAFLTACLVAGHPLVDDHNAPGALGAGPLPLNEVDNVRQSTALTYLAGARDRPNLAIRCDEHVDRVLIERDATGRVRAAGVRLADGEEIEAARVALTAGAYGFPAILLRSGIGPGRHLLDLGLPVHRDLPGVGANLHDHPLVRLPFTARGEPDAQHRQTLLTLDPDLQVFPSGIAPGGELTLLVALVKPYSRGTVHLRSTDPRDRPDIDVGLLRDPADAPRLMAGVREALRLAGTPPLGDLLTDGPHPDDATIRELTGVYQHPVGTCRMGPPGYPYAVVDPAGRVQGMDGLLVADASIMPVIPRANTNLPVMMIAEHLAAVTPRW